MAEYSPLTKRVKQRVGDIHVPSGSFEDVIKYFSSLEKEWKGRVNSKVQVLDNYKNENDRGYNLSYEDHYFDTFFIDEINDEYGQYIVAVIGERNMTPSEQKFFKDESDRNKKWR